jgi:hypothetical protein
MIKNEYFIVNLRSGLCILTYRPLACSTASCRNALLNSKIRFHIWVRRNRLRKYTSFLLINQFKLKIFLKKSIKNDK